MIYLVFYTVLLAVLEALRDAYAILNHTYSSNQKLSHRFAWMSRAASIIVPVLVMFNLTIKTGFAGMVLGLVFWEVFELVLNWKRKVPLFYVGYNAWTDKQIRWIAGKLGAKPERINMYLKTGIFIILITLAIVWQK